MQHNVFIFHGTAGYPNENWFPWMKEKLEHENCRVTVPQFPPPENDTLESRLEILKPYRSLLNKDAIVIGHSRGGLFMFRLLEQLKEPVHASFFVAASIGIQPYTYYHEGNKFAHGYEFDWPKIKSKSEKFFVYHSDNDPYTCISNGKEIAKHLEVSLVNIPNAGHFNTQSGYKTFDRLLQDVKSVL